MIKTRILGTSKLLTEDYDKSQTESMNILLERINHKWACCQVDNEDGNLTACFDDIKVDFIPIERLMSSTNESFWRETHTFCYVKASRTGGSTVTSGGWKEAVYRRPH